MARLSVLHAGAVVLVVVIAAVAVTIYWTQLNKSTTKFEVLPIEKPEYDITLDKPASYINIAVKNTGTTNETAVQIKASGGYANSSNEVPSQLFIIVTKSLDVIVPGQTVTIKTFSHNWASYYKIEVTSSEGTDEVFNQWVTWRSWDVTPPSS